MPVFYHNPRCSKSCAALAYLQENSADFEVVEYLARPLDENDLRRLCNKLGMRPYDLVRRKDPYYRELDHQKADADHHAFWYTLLARHPRLMERPIYETATQAAIGRPLENITALL